MRPRRYATLGLVLTRHPGLATHSVPDRGELTVPLTRHGDTVVLEPTGFVDLATVHLFATALHSGAAAARATVVLDLTRTSFLACCAIGPITAMRRDLESGGRRLVITGARGIVRRVLLVCDLRAVVTDDARQPPAALVGAAAR